MVLWRRNPREIKISSVVDWRRIAGRGAHSVGGGGRAHGLGSLLTATIGNQIENEIKFYGEKIWIKADRMCGNGRAAESGSHIETEAHQNGSMCNVYIYGFMHLCSCVIHISFNHIPNETCPLRCPRVMKGVGWGGVRVRLRAHECVCVFFSAPNVE